MIYPQHISLCTSTIENAGYVNRMSGVVRGRRLVTASYSIVCPAVDQQIKCSFILRIKCDFLGTDLAC